MATVPGFSFTREPNQLTEPNQRTEPMQQPRGVRAGLHSSAD